jgi:NAD(P)-dependent dehydrogenase (short-subunit alcohol dehydrogenase family)
MIKNIELKLNGKTAVIIGGTGDIGYATARLLIDDGAKVVIPDVSNHGLKSELSHLAQRHTGSQPIRPMRESYMQSSPVSVWSITSF